MEFEKMREGWLPMEDPQFHVEEWDCPDRTDESPSGDAYYVVSTTNGTELMNTTDWSLVVSYLRAILGEDCVPDDSLNDPAMV
jgi:hypothetical protein